MNPLTGRIVIEKLAVQDPNRQEENFFELGKFVGDVSLLDLLSERFVFDEVAVTDLTFHLRREEDGSFNVEDLDVITDALYGKAPDLSVAHRVQSTLWAARWGDHE